MTKEKLKEFIKKSIKEVNNIKESDLISTPNEWEKMKTRFSTNVINLIQNIEDDEYEDASNVIGETIGMLKFWKGKIKLGLEKRGGEEYDINKFDLKTDVIDEKMKDSNDIKK